MIPTAMEEGEVMGVLTVETATLEVVVVIAMTVTLEVAEEVKALAAAHEIYKMSFAFTLLFACLVMMLVILRHLRWKQWTPV